MNEYYIKYAVEGEEATFENITKKMADCQERIFHVVRSLKRCASPLHAVASRVTESAKDVETISESISSCGDVFVQIVRLYLASEKNVYSTLNGEQDFDFDSLISGIKGAISAAGPVGSHTALIANIIGLALDPSAKQGIEIAKSAVSYTSDIVGLVSKGGSNVTWKDYLGASEYFDDVDSVKGKNWLGRFGASVKQEVGAYKDFDDGFKATKTVLKWGGAALTVAGNTLQAQEDVKSGKIREDQVFERVVVHSAVDIGKDIAVGAVVAATMGAAAPAVTVAAVAVGATMLVDFTTKQLTGKSATEWLYQGADALAEPAFNAVGNCVNNGVKNVSTWWRSSFGY